jgi:hypothetical protein
MNTSNFALGAILSQPKEDNLFHPVGFCSCKFYPTKIKYEIHDKGLLAIVDAFEEWCHIFEGVQHEITMYSNHMNFQYFMTVCLLNQYKIRWALSLFQFWFMITYHPRQQ